MLLSVSTPLIFESPTSALKICVSLQNSQHWNVGVSFMDFNCRCHFFATSNQVSVKATSSKCQKQTPSSLILSEIAHHMGMSCWNLVSCSHQVCRAAKIKENLNPTNDQTSPGLHHLHHLLSQICHTKAPVFPGE